MGLLDKEIAEYMFRRRWRLCRICVFPFVFFESLKKDIMLKKCWWLWENMLVYSGNCKVGCITNVSGWVINIFSTQILRQPTAGYQHIKRSY